MRGAAVMAGVALAVVALSGGRARAVDPAARVDVPIGQTVLPNGDTRYHVPVSIGGGPAIEAELDTGSFGVRVLTAALSGAQYESTDIERAYPYGSGARFHGPLATARIAVGAAETGVPVVFQVVQRVDCVEQKPLCPASKLSQGDYRIAGDGIVGQGFDAILGISLRKAPVEVGANNPLGAMGGASWIVILPRPGDAGPGHLIINPGPEETAGYRLIHLSRQSSRGGANDATAGWKDAALSGCLVNGDTNERLCGPTLLDSGAPGFVANSASAGRPTSWKRGTNARLELSGAAEPIRIPFTVGPDLSTTVHVVPPPNSSEGTRISAGSFPFFSYNVLYDADAGTIGFKARD